jgi:membrane protease subunit HflK
MPSESMMLTGDENMVDLDFTVRWRIADPKNFLFNVASPEQTIRDISESAMREVINRHPIDHAFGDGRGQIQAEVRTLMQRIVDTYKVGVEVTSVELQQVNPPQEVISAFRDVQAARADAEKMRNEALGYANDILPRARGEAAQMVQDAEAYKEAKVTEAEGLASRFANQRSAYVQGPEVMKRRLYVETMEELMKNANVIMMGSQSAGNILPYLPLQPKAGEGK